MLLANQTDAVPAPEPSLAQFSRSLAALARGRIDNARTRMGGVIGVAAPACLVAQSWLPAYWALGFMPILLFERGVHRRLLAKCEAGETPQLGPALAWTVLQSAYANTIAIWLWFAPYEHSESAAVFFLMACLANAAASLRADERFMLAGIAPTLIAAFALPLADFILGGFRSPLDLIPALAAALFSGFGFTIWQSLQASDAALRAAENAAVREQQAQASASAARATTIARVQELLRTPLAALHGAVERVRRTERGMGEQVLSLVHADAAVRAAMGGVASLAGEQPGGQSAAPCDPRELARGCVGAFMVPAHDRGLELFLDIDADVPALVELNEIRVRRILYNLIANAIAFTRHGGVRVRLQTRASEQAGHVRLGFCVADTGLGLSRAQLGLLFHGDLELDGPHHGLALARRLARSVGASITAKSELGEGTVVSLVIDAPLLEPGAEALQRALG